MQLGNEVKQMAEKLIKLREEIALVSTEERQAVEKIYTNMINKLRKCKRMFKDVWDKLQRTPKNLKEFKEELGVEYDEDVSVSLRSFGELVKGGKKRPRCNRTFSSKTLK
ncbi:homologous-pairing protein 2 homolog [Phtheirospermum japonicum]|uniref:Homologous-pairing protein 2 homolog n=1 Tax=Phtheirospermum japonicum TaxID=374723 RepID=A0A830CNS8_9LAMI|nr:homologous-pairing protein 2 homolog [Phtheirospermum japonicum]